MNTVRIKQLEVNNFRRFKKFEVSIGENITFIAGQNGTSKSTLLGMLAQPFSFGSIRGDSANKSDNSSYSNIYHGKVLTEYVDLSGKYFMYDCKDVFRLSKNKDWANNQTYDYKTHLEFSLSKDSNLKDNCLITKSKRTKEKKTGKVTRMRFVTSPIAVSHQSGDGNFPHPVIYLGLKRLWPLADATTCAFTGDDLSGADGSWFVDKYNEILCLDEPNNTAQFMDTKEKRKFITPEASDYDGESCSAGQDNIGQILTAILSFRRLKKSLNERYRGGMLLIDELDATLHAHAQEKLLELLVGISTELELQIVATTHSLRLLELAYNSKSKKFIQVRYLSNMDGHVIVKPLKSYDELSDLLKIQSTLPVKKKTRKVSVIFEDKEAQFLFSAMIGKKLDAFIAVKDIGSLAAGDLKNLAEMAKKLPELQDVIFIPDGDMVNTWANPPKNLITLPGACRIETLIYRHLFTMKDSDPFWEKCNSSGNTYTRQVAITAAGGKSEKTGDDKKWVKKWYQNQSAYWGRSNNIVLKSWVQSNKDDCYDFCNKFLKLLKKQYKGNGVSKEVSQKILAPFKH